MSLSLEIIDAEKMNVHLDRINGVSKDRWRFCRNLMNDFEFRAKSKEYNRAFFKLWEILAAYPALCNSAVSRSCHLGEAPGSFAQVCLQRNPSLRCVLLSKPPMTYAEVTRTGSSTPMFYPSLQSNPNVSCLYVDLNDDRARDDAIQRVKKLAPGKLPFITADGGFDENGAYDQKEALHVGLIRSEVMAILALQEIGGSAVLKIYDSFMTETIDVIYELCRHYDFWAVYKPKTSRPTNSERYIIVQGFKGDMCKDKISFSSFIECLTGASQQMLKTQRKAITEALSCCKGTQSATVKERKDIQARTFDQWCTETSFPDFLKTPRSRRTPAFRAL